MRTILKTLISNDFFLLSAVSLCVINKYRTIYSVDGIDSCWKNRYVKFLGASKDFFFFFGPHRSTQVLGNISFISLYFFMMYLNSQIEWSRVSYYPFKRHNLSFALKYCFFWSKYKFMEIFTETSYVVFSHLVHGNLWHNTQTRNRW